LAHLSKPTPSAASTPLKLPALLNRRFDVTLTGGQLHMGDDGSTYRFALHAGSLSLTEAPWQWQFALSGPTDAALTVDGELHHLVSTEPLVGHAEVNISQLDLAVLTSLLPLHAAWQPRGRIQQVQARLVFEGIQGVNIMAGLASEVSYGVTMGVLPAAFELRDTVDLAGRAGLRIPVIGPIEPRHISYAGEVRLQNLLFEGDTSESLTARLNLEQGRLTIETARADMLDGEMRIASASFVDLQGPVHDFDVHVVAKDLQLQVHSGKRVALSRFLFWLAPLFIIEPKRNEPASMAGTLVAEMALSGSFSGESGWSKAVNGEGFFRIAEGAILGSTLVGGLTTKAVTLPWNMVHNTLTGLFAADSRVGSEIASLGQKAFVFGTIESPIQVRAGAVHLQPNFEVRSPEFSMLINGYSTLEGDLDYRVRTDLIERLRFGSITSLPNQLPIIGDVIRSINPFTLLEGIELEATMQGNAFRKNAEAKIDLNVHTSILR
jgi:hypothetical protein